VLWDPWDFTGANDMQLALNIIYQEGFERFCDFAFLRLSVCCGVSAILHCNVAPCERKNKLTSFCIVSHAAGNSLMVRGSCPNSDHS
jgi:hypothetical protein